MSSIKSDRWIRSKCVPPTHVFKGDGEYFFMSPLTKEHATLMEYRAEKCGGEFRVPTDAELSTWDAQMIEPFVGHQVRSNLPYSTYNEYLEHNRGKKYEGTAMLMAERDFEAHMERNKIISYGLSSYGYDVRCADEFKVFTNINSTIVDPKNFDPQCFVDVKSDVCIIPPNSFALARTVEYMRIPRDVLTICLGKSTYARCGIIVNVTPLEPEWEGHVTLEFSNTTNLPAKIYANEGVAQFLFFQSDDVCETSYKDRGGKYQGQTGVTLPKA